MSTHDQQDENLDDQGDQTEEILEEGQEASDSKKKGAMAWVISAAVHATMLAIVAIVVVSAPKMIEQDTPPVRINPIDPPQKEKDKPKEKRELETVVELDTPTESDIPSPTTNLDVPTEVAEREVESDANTAKGREEATADAETGGSGAFMTIGAGGGSAGMFGNRNGGGRKRAVGKGGGNKGSEGAVEASLRWFKRHQSANGSWESDKYFQNCTEGAKCEPGGASSLHGSECNVAMTGYALLCFLGAGYDHKTQNKYKSTVKKGIDWILSKQKNDGYIGLRNYEHPVAVMALAEAYAMTADAELRVPSQKGVDQILAQQNLDKEKGPDGYIGGMGWDYRGPTDRNDSSVTGWNIMALKSALAGGLNVGRGMEGSKHWFEGHWRSSNPKKEGVFKEYKDITAYDRSRFAYSWLHSKNMLEDHGQTGREAIGLTCAVFLGHLSGDVMAESLANEVMASQVPKGYPTNTYYMYYNTLAIFQMGGDRWTKWNSTVRDLLVNSQKKTTDCFDGSWEWQATEFAGHELGRVLTTAYNTLSLEVYYRYAQVKDLQKK